MPRKAMILAAGLGTRLKPVTANKPKALVEYRGVTLLEQVILKLKSSGFGEIIINIHHFPDRIMEFVKSRQNFGIRIEFSDEREKLLDTGGALKHASWFFDDRPFLVYNVDIMSDIDLEAMYAFHLAHEPLATLAVRERETSRSLLVGPGNLLAGWRDNRTGQEIIARPDESLYPIAFSGIHVIDPRIFPLFGDEEVFSIMDSYLKLAGRHDILLYRHDGDDWKDMGKPGTYL